MEDTLRVPVPVLLIVKSLVLVVLIMVCPKSQLVGLQLMIGAVGISRTVTLSTNKSLSPLDAVDSP